MHLEQRLAALEKADKQKATLIEAQRASIARLSTENEAHSTSLTQLSSSLARLSSENEALRTRNEEQGTILVDLSRKAFPKGCWIWSKSEMEDKQDGRWAWSLSEQEKKLTQSRAVVRRVVLLLSLPVELLLLIASFLEKNDRLRLALVCFRFFDILSQELYSKAFLKEARVVSFFEANRDLYFSTSHRLDPLRSMKSLALRTPSSFPDFPPSNGVTQPLVRVRRLRVTARNLQTCVAFYAPLLRIVEPICFSIYQQRNAGLPPTVVRVPASLFSFTEGWRRVEQVRFYGPSSLPFLEGSSDTLAISIQGRQPNSSQFLIQHRDKKWEWEGTRFSSSLVLDRLNSHQLGSRVEKNVGVVAFFTEGKPSVEGRPVSGDSFLCI